MNSTNAKSMTVHGYIRVAACCPEVKLADCDANLQEITRLWAQARQEGAQVTLFPEMSITGYTCGDLFHSSTLLTRAWESLVKLVKSSENQSGAVIVGLPVKIGNALYNCAAIISNGQYKLVGKANVPNYNEFYERRYWQPVPSDALIEGDGKQIHGASTVVELGELKCAVEICEDLWVPASPSIKAVGAGAQIIFNLSASPDQIGKYEYLLNLLKQQSAQCICGYVYASAGWGESSTDLVFDGKAVIAECGSILAKNTRFNQAEQMVVADIDLDAISHDRIHFTSFAPNVQGIVPQVVLPFTSLEQKGLKRIVNPHPFVPSDTSHRNQRCEEIINIQAAGLARRLHAIGCKNLVIGISGGLDSTLALLVAVKAFDWLGLNRKGITGVTMPGFGTTGRTHNNALSLMELLGVDIKEINITPAVRQHFADIGHDEGNHDVTYENSQARERTQLLMDLANKSNGIVLGTGDLSELALGWATYNGDHMSMYGVNVGVPKTLVAHLVRYFAREYTELTTVLTDIADTPISPELTPADEHGEIAQKTEDLVGPYELHDFFLYQWLRYGFDAKKIYFLARNAFTEEAYRSDVIKKWLKTFMRRFFNQQFKRSCLPDGPKVGSVCLSPRGDWRMPSDASCAMFLRQVPD